jgi:hypothetical protein
VTVEQRVKGMEGRGRKRERNGNEAGEERRDEKTEKDDDEKR